MLVFGLYLDGAQWNGDTRVLADTMPDERFACLIELYFEPTLVSYYYFILYQALAIVFFIVLSCSVYYCAVYCELCNVLRDSCPQHNTIRSVVARGNPVFTQLLCFT